jgi:hypothetical protein
MDIDRLLAEGRRHYARVCNLQAKREVGLFLRTGNGVHMNRFRRFVALSTAIASLCGGFALIASGATPAQAITCGTVYHRDFQDFLWAHSTGGTPDVDGVRAGIKFRLDGALCDWSGPGSDQDVSIWIAVVGTGGAGKIVQMGFGKEYNPFGITETCFFYAIEGGVPVNYHCTGMADGNEENFYIHPSPNGTHYYLSDCGTNTSDYSSCTLKDGTQAVWAEPSGSNSEEEIDGACDVHTFGAQSNQEKIGGVTGDPELPLQGLANGTWMSRSWGRQNDLQGCGDPPYHYQLKEANPSRGLNWYDTRNAS